MRRANKDTKALGEPSQVKHCRCGDVLAEIAYVSPKCTQY